MSVPLLVCTVSGTLPWLVCTNVCMFLGHIGSCPPCSIPLIVPCRCGLTTHAIRCHELSSNPEILCDKPCSALRACGRHRCNRICCPLGTLDSSSKGKGKKRQAQTRALEGLELGFGIEARWHDCDLTCGKLLGCGNHRCEERDHRGACPPCMRSSFDEVSN